MPTLRETAINKPLTGAELRELLRRDFDRLLANEGSLSNHIAYGRVGYELILRLHTANPLIPIAESQMKSRSPSVTELEGTKNSAGVEIAEPRPELAAVETPPLRNLGAEDESSIGGTTLQRTITSPNAERIREGLPVPVEVRQQDGTKTIERIVYPRSKDMDPDGAVHIADSTADAKSAFGR